MSHVAQPLAASPAALQPASRPVTAVLSEVGPLLLGVALAGMGVQCLLTGAPVPGLEPLPKTLPAVRLMAFLSGLLLVAGGGAVAGHRRAPRAALVALGVLFFTWTLALHLPRVAAAPANGSAWTAAFEAAALGGAAWALTATSDLSGGYAREHQRTRYATLGRVAYGLGLVVFGVLHLVYRDFVALLVPAWIPGKSFWAVATGVAHLAAGLGLLTGVLARAAAAWVGAMFGAWVLVVHAPRVLHTPGDPREWASLLVALGMCGGAWGLAARVPSGPGRTSGVSRRLRGAGVGPLAPHPAAEAARTPS